jgi:hypothetical protein
LFGQKKIDDKSLDKLFWEGKYNEVEQDYYILYLQNVNNPEICFKYGTSLLFESDSVQNLVKANNLLLFAASQNNALAEYHFYCGKAYHARSIFDSALVQFEFYKSKKSKKTIELPVDEYIKFCQNGKSMQKISTGNFERQLSEISFDKIGLAYRLPLIKIDGEFINYNTELTKIDLKRGNKPVRYVSDYTTKYFASYGEKDDGQKDLYLVEGTRDQKKITRLPEFINTKEDEDFPYFDFETNYLYFSSKGHNSMGGYDIYRVEYDTATQSFGKVENLGLGISTPFDDYLFIYNSKVNQALITSGYLGKTNTYAIFKGNITIPEKTTTKKQQVLATFKNEINSTIKLTDIRVIDRNSGEKIGEFKVDENGSTFMNLSPGDYTYLLSIYGSKDDFTAEITIPAESTQIIHEISYKLDDKNNERVLINQGNSDSEEIIAQNTKKDIENPNPLLQSDEASNETEKLIDPVFEKEALQNLDMVGYNQNEVVERVSDKIIEIELAQKENEILMSNLNVVIVNNRDYFNELQQEIDSIEQKLSESSEIEKIEKLNYIKNLVSEQKEVLSQTLWMQNLNDSLHILNSESNPEKRKFNEIQALGNVIQELTIQNKYEDAYAKIIKNHDQIQTITINPVYEKIYSDLHENELEQVRIEKNILTISNEQRTLAEELKNTDIEITNASKKERISLETKREEIQQKINSNQKRLNAYQRDLNEIKSKTAQFELKRNLISTVAKEVFEETVSYDEAKKKYFDKSTDFQEKINVIQDKIEESNGQLTSSEKKYLVLVESYQAKKNNLDENSTVEQIIEIEQELANNIKNLLSEENFNSEKSNSVIYENYLQEKLQESQNRLQNLEENNANLASSSNSTSENEENSSENSNVAKNQPMNSQNNQENQTNTSSNSSNEKEENSSENSNVAKNQPANSQNNQENQTNTSSNSNRENEENSSVNSNVAKNEPTNSQNNQQNQPNTSSNSSNEKEENSSENSNVAKNQPANSQNNQQNQINTSSNSNRENEENSPENSNVAKNQPANSQNNQQNQTNTSSNSNREIEENSSENSNVAKNQPTNSQNNQQNQTNTSSNSNRENEENSSENSNIAKNQPSNSQNNQQNQTNTSSNSNRENEENSSENSNVAKNQPANSQNNQQNQTNTSSNSNTENEENSSENSNVTKNQPANSQNNQQNQTNTSSNSNRENEENSSENSNVAKNQPSNSQNNQQNQTNTSSNSNRENEENSSENSNVAKNQPVNSQNNQQNQTNNSSKLSNENKENSNVAKNQTEYIPQIKTNITEVKNEELVEASSEFVDNKKSVVQELKKTNPTILIQSIDQLNYEKFKIENQLSTLEKEIEELKIEQNNQKTKKEVEKIENSINEKEQQIVFLINEKSELENQINQHDKKEIILTMEKEPISIDEQKSQEILASESYKEYVTKIVQFEKEKENYDRLSKELETQQIKLNELINIQVLTKDKKNGSVEIESLVKEIEKSQELKESSYTRLTEIKNSVAKVEQDNPIVSNEMKVLAANRKEPLTKIEQVKDNILSSGGFEINANSTTSSIENKTIPMNVKAPSGLIYRVQVGAFRKPLQNNVYSQFTPVSGELQQNGLTVYMAGYFNSSSNAINARKQIQSLGYSDAFIVAYCNGKKLTLGEARQLEAKGECIPQGDNEFLVEISKNTQAALKEQNSNSTTSMTSEITDSKSFFFTVQIGVYNKPINEKEKFPSLPEISTSISPKKQIRYATGKFTNLNEAKTRKNEAVASGISDAFIVAYYKGERITIAQATELISKNEEVLYAGTKEPTNSTSNGAVRYIENEVKIFKETVQIEKIENFKYEVNTVFEELPKEKLAYFNKYGFFQFDTKSGKLSSTEFSRKIDLADEVKLSGLVTEIREDQNTSKKNKIKVEELTGDLMDVFLRTNWINSIESSKEISLILNSNFSTNENYTNLLKNTFDLKIESYDKK